MVDAFWRLAGPAAFLNKAAASTLGAHNGIAGVALPDRRPPGFKAALSETLVERGGRVIPISFDRHVHARSIPHVLAQAGGVPATSIRSVEGLATSPELSGAVFLIDGV